MRKLTITAALVVAMLSAKAQSIRVLNSCYAPSKTFVFIEADAYSEKIRAYTIESACSQKQLPPYRLPIGNYEFHDLPVHDGEMWSWFIETNGKTSRRGTIENKSLVVQLGENERLTVVIFPVQDPTKPVSADSF